MNIKDIEIKETGRFLKLAEGNNYIRIVSPFVVREETYKNGDSAVKYCCYVIDRKDGEIRIASFSKSIFKQLQNLAVSQDYGFEEVPGYDMNIHREGLTQMDTKYTVVAARKDTPLTDEEQAKVAFTGSIEDAFQKNGPQKDTSDYSQEAPMEPPF